MKILIAFIVFIFSAQCSSNNIQPFEAHEKCLSNNTLCNRRNASSVNSIPANTNMVNYSIQTGITSYEVFDSSTFHNRSLSQETTDPLSQIISQNNMPKSIISTDERFQITNAKIQPYLSTAKLIAKYDNVYNQATKEYQKRENTTTGVLGPLFLLPLYALLFLLSRPLVVGSGRCAESKHELLSLPRFLRIGESS